MCLKAKLIIAVVFGSFPNLQKSEKCITSGKAWIDRQISLCLKTRCQTKKNETETF